MSIFHILAILLLFFSTLQSCPTSHQLDTCTFYVSYSDNTCFSFSFDNCTYQQCSNGDDDCQNYHYRSSNSWSMCTWKCCENNQYYSRTAQGINQCMEGDTQNSSITVSQPVIIALTVVASVGIGFGLICCYIRRNRRTADFNNFNNPSYQRRIIQVPIPKPAIPFQPVWTRQQNHSPVLDNTCSICLDDRPTVQLACGHLYHRWCIISYMQRKIECGLCRLTNFEVVKVYCQMCFESVFESSLMMYQRELATGQLVCISCRQAESSGMALMGGQKALS